MNTKWIIIHYLVIYHYRWWHNKTPQCLRAKHKTDSNLIKTDIQKLFVAIIFDFAVPIISSGRFYFKKLSYTFHQNDIYLRFMDNEFIQYTTSLFCNFLIILDSKHSDYSPREWQPTRRTDHVTDYYLLQLYYVHYHLKAVRGIRGLILCYGFPPSNHASKDKNHFHATHGI